MITLNTTNLHGLTHTIITYFNRGQRTTNKIITIKHQYS